MLQDAKHWRPITRLPVFSVKTIMQVRLARPVNLHSIFHQNLPVHHALSMDAKPALSIAVWSASATTQESMGNVFPIV